jgi:hypothetical protein
MPSTPKPGRPDSPAMRRHAVNAQARAPCRAHRPAPEQPGLRVLSEPDGIVSQGQWKTCFEPDDGQNRAYFLFSLRFG